MEPVVVGTILSLVIHSARRRRFFASELCVPAAGLLGAFSFPSGDRNFDYFPGDRLTSKKCVLIPATREQRVQLCCCARISLRATLLRDDRVNVDNASCSCAISQERSTTEGGRGSRRVCGNYQHSRRFLGYIFERIRIWIGAGCVDADRDVSGDRAQSARSVNSSLDSSMAFNKTDETLSRDRGQEYAICRSRRMQTRVRNT